MLFQTASRAPARPAAHALIAVLLLVPCLAVAVCTAAGQPPEGGGATSVRVEDLVARALANAPSVGARRARLEAAVAALAAADAPPDPRAEFEIRDAGFPRWTLGSDVMSMIGVSVTQELTGAARRTARHAFAEAEIEERRAETDSTACDLTAAVRTSFARLYAVDQERAIIDSAREVAHLLVETASARYASGESDQAAVLRAQLEQTRLGERMADLRTERAVVVATLNRLTNSPAESPIGAVQALPDPLPLPSPLADLPNLAGDVAAEVLERRAAVEAASQRVDLARADLTPTYSVGGGVDWQGGVDRIVSVTLGVTWPARKSRKQLPAIAASVQDLQAAREDLADMAAEARAEAVRLVAEIPPGGGPDHPLPLWAPTAVPRRLRRDAGQLPVGPG